MEKKYINTEHFYEEISFLASEVIGEINNALKNTTKPILVNQRTIEDTCKDLIVEVSYNKEEEDTYVKIEDENGYLVQTNPLREESIDVIMNVAEYINEYFIENNC